MSGYLSDRWLTDDSRIDALLADKQLTADSVEELRQLAVDEQWTDDQPQQPPPQRHHT